MENLLILFTRTFGMLDEYSVEDIPDETRWLHRFAALFQLYKDDGDGTFRRTAAANFLLRFDGCLTQANRFIEDFCPNHLRQTLVEINTGHQRADPELKKILIETDLMEIATGNRLALTVHGQMALRRRQCPSLGIGLLLLERLSASGILFNHDEENLNGMESDAADSGLDVLDPVRRAIQSARERLLLDSAEQMLIPLEIMIDHLLTGVGQTTEESGLVAKLELVDRRNLLLNHNWGPVIDLAVQSIQYGRTTENLNDRCEQIFYGSAAYEAVFACAAEAFFQIL